MGKNPGHDPQACVGTIHSAASNRQTMVYLISLKTWNFTKLANSYTRVWNTPSIRLEVSFSATAKGFQTTQLIICCFPEQVFIKFSKMEMSVRKFLNTVRFWKMLYTFVTKVNALQYLLQAVRWKPGQARQPIFLYVKFIYSLSLSLSLSWSLYGQNFHSDYPILTRSHRHLHVWNSENSSYGNELLLLKRGQNKTLANMGNIRN
jgi:hypothetical protein